MIGDLSQREDEIGGKTLLIVGLGDIGGRLARLAKTFDMRVVGLRRHSAIGRGAADAEHAMEELSSLLPNADFVALACPLTFTLRGYQALGLVRLLCLRQRRSSLIEVPTSDGCCRGVLLMI
jgi:hypothetical protein